jgi:hypothetical protein
MEIKGRAVAELPSRRSPSGLFETPRHPDHAAWDHSVFSKNRDRLLEGDIAASWSTPA